MRGFKRLQTRFFGAEIAPPTQVYEAALDFKLAGLARAIDQSHVEAKLVRRGLGVEVVAGQPGRRLAQDLAAGRIVRALARLERGQPIALPVVLDPVEVTATELAPAAAQARPRSQLPSGSSTRARAGGAALADRRAAEPPRRGRHRHRDRRPRRRGLVREAAQDRRAAPADATFRAVGDGVEIVAARNGLAVDVPATARALLAAAVSRDDRTATLAVRTAEPDRTTAEAQAMGIERRPPRTRRCTRARPTGSRTSSSESHS